MSNSHQNDGGAKGFFIHHGEKVGLACAVLLVGLFFIMGSGVTSIKDDQTPDNLVSIVKRGEAHIGMDNTDILLSVREPDMELEDKIDLEAIDPGNYGIEDFGPGGGGKIEAIVRHEPELIAPSKPEIRTKQVALAIRPRRSPHTNAIDGLPLAKLDAETLKKIEDAKRPAVPVRGTRGDGGGDASGDPYGGSGAFGGPDDSLGGGSDGTGGDPYGGGGDPYGGGGPDGGGSFGGPDLSGPTADGEHKVLPTDLYRRFMGEQYWQAKGDSSKMEIMGRFMVSGVAVVPVKQQWEKFEEVLNSSTMGFDPRFDRPEYYEYEVQRQDITDGPDGPKEIITDTNVQLAMAAWYPDRVKEVVDPRYIDPVLTSPIPTLLLTPYEQFALHSLTPKEEKAVDAVEDGESDPMDDDDIFKGTADASERPATSAVGGSPYGTGVGTGDSTSGDPYGGGDGTGGDPYGGSDFGPSDGLGDSGAAGSPYGGGTSTTMKGPAPPEVDYKLVRFYDFTAEAGRKYVYRVRVILIDPHNHPRRSADALGPQMFPAEVYARAKKQRREDEEASAEATAKARAKDQKAKPVIVYTGIESEWSEPSDPIMVQDLSREVFSGSAVAAVPTPLKDYQYTTKEPSATLAISEWDETYGMSMSAKRDVELGTVLNWTGRADVLHPLTKKIHMDEEYEFDTDWFVADIQGGEKLATASFKTPVFSEGEILVVDDKGNLIARNEFDDLETYRERLMVNDEVESPLSGPAAAGSTPAPAFGLPF